MLQNGAPNFDQYFWGNMKQDVCLRTSFAYSSYLCLRNKRLIGSKLLQALNIDAQEATRPHC